jgi:hypothetical protein
MFDWLFDAIAQLAIDAVNGLIAGFALVLQGLYAVLPDMPALPAVPSEVTEAASWVSWVFPVGTLVDILVFILAMYLTWQAVAIALRWAKALNS